MQKPFLLLKNWTQKEQNKSMSNLIHSIFLWRLQINVDMCSSKQWGHFWPLGYHWRLHSAHCTPWWIWDMICRTTAHRKRLVCTAFVAQWGQYHFYKEFVFQFLLKVSYFQNEFMKIKLLPKNERKIARISALWVRAEILAIFHSFFGRSFIFINSFWK